jgi:hypothetical protein
MLKPALGLAAASLLGLVLWKLLAFLLLPMLGVALAMLFTVIKFMVLAGLVLFVVWLFRRLAQRQTDTA